MTQKDADKLKALYELYEQPMYRIAFAVLHSSEAAEDAVSEAFVRLIGHLDKLDSAESEKTKKIHSQSDKKHCCQRIPQA